MKYLIVAETTLTNPSWVEAYLLNVTPLLARFGGRYLTRSGNTELLEGESQAQYTLVAEFPSKANALAFYESDEYHPYKTARQRGSFGTFTLVPVENTTA